MKSFLLLLLSVVACRAGDLPNPALTPGFINPAVTDPCTTLWGHDARHVTDKMKRQVFSSYGIPWSDHSLYEVDHLISRELGGADDVRNLWPQHWASPWGAHEKDRLENRLHKLVCTGQMSLAKAQNAIGTDWIAEYKRQFP